MSGRADAGMAFDDAASRICSPPVECFERAQNERTSGRGGADATGMASKMATCYRVRRGRPAFVRGDECQAIIHGVAVVLARFPAADFSLDSLNTSRRNSAAAGVIYFSLHALVFDDHNARLHGQSHISIIYGKAFMAMRRHDDCRLMLRYLKPFRGDWRMPRSRHDFARISPGLRNLFIKD